MTKSRPNPHHHSLTNVAITLHLLRRDGHLPHRIPEVNRWAHVCQHGLRRPLIQPPVNHMTPQGPALHLRAGTSCGRTTTPPKRSMTCSRQHRLQLQQPFPGLVVCERVTCRLNPAWTGPQKCLSPAVRPRH